MDNDQLTSVAIEHKQIRNQFKKWARARGSDMSKELRKFMVSVLRNEKNNENRKEEG